MLRIIVGVLLFLTVLCANHTNNEVVKRNFIYNTYKYDTRYNVTVNNYTEQIMDFYEDSDIWDGYPTRVHVSTNDSITVENPIFVTATQQKGISSWEIPLLVQAKDGAILFSNLGLTLCPHDAGPDIKTEHRPMLQITTSNPKNVNLDVKVRRVTDFYVDVNKDVELTVTPSSPKYFYFSFDNQPWNVSESGPMQMRARSNSTIPESVLLKIDSDDNLCATVSVQNHSCPVFGSEMEVFYKGYFLTMMTKGGITLTRSMYPSGFYIVFIVNQNDETCTGPSEVTGASNYTRRLLSSDDRMKNFRFRVIATISYREYVVGALVTIALVCVVALIVPFALFACSCRWRESEPIVHASTSGEASSADCARMLDDTDDELDREHEASASGSGEARASAEGTRTLTGAAGTEASASGSGEARASAEGTRTLTGAAGTEASASGSGEARASAEGTRTLNGAAGTEASASGSGEARASAEGTRTLTGAAGTEDDTWARSNPLTVQRLTRTPAATQSRRSNRYFWGALTVAIVYALPVVQLLVTYQRIIFQTGNHDLCYYNFLCAHPLGFLSDFNHVFSNVGYVVLGLVFMVQVAYRQRQSKAIPQDMGVPQHYGLLYSMGLGLVMEGLLSACYHLCPNNMNFQFDSSFMYVIAVLVMIKLYQNRHSDIIPRAHTTFLTLAFIMTLGVFGILYPSAAFSAIFTIIHLLACLVLTLKIYYAGNFTLEWSAVVRGVSAVRSDRWRALLPAHRARAIFVLIANFGNWTFAIYSASIQDEDFASKLLAILMGNAILYTMFYIFMKIVHLEKIPSYTQFYFGLAFISWILALKLFMDARTMWSETPAQSRRLNAECTILQLYDSHDAWHLVSAAAMFLSFNMLLTVDDYVVNRPRSSLNTF